MASDDERWIDHISREMFNKNFPRTDISKAVSRKAFMIVEGKRPWIVYPGEPYWSYGAIYKPIEAIEILYKLDYSVGSIAVFLGMKIEEVEEIIKEIEAKQTKEERYASSEYRS